MAKIITVGREFGSGGREVGKRLADELHIAYYDREIISEIAKKSELDENYVESILEKGLPSTMFLTFGHTFSSFQLVTESSAMNILSAQREVVRKLAGKDCVIVGRCADLILKDLHPFRLFVYADEKSKLERCRKRAPEDEQLSDKKLLKKMKKIDKSRKRIHDMYMETKWGERDGYDLCVNTSGVDIKKIAPSLAEYVNRFYENK